MILKNGKRIDGCSDTVPIGTLNPYVGSTAPYGYLLCQGQLVSKTTYKELYEICGNTFGTATATEFYLPDLRGRTIVGYKEGDSTFGTLGGLIGSITSTTGNHTLTAAESGIPSHEHYKIIIDSTELKWGAGTPAGSKLNLQDSGASWTGGESGGSMLHAGPSVAVAAVSAHNHGDVSTIQPSMNLNYIVKAFMLMPNQSYVANTTQESSVNTYSCDYINDNISNGIKLNENLRITDGSYYNLPLDTIGKNAIYSTDEIVVGAWINGKPLYRKVYTSFTELSDTSYNYIIIDTDATKEIVSFTGTITVGNFKVTIPTPDAGLGMFSGLYKNRRNQLFVTTTADFTNISDFNGTLLYTKTTD